MDKVFNYKFLELNISIKSIFVNTNEIHGIDKLKRKISSDIKLPEESIQFVDPPKKELKDLDDFTTFTLTLFSLYPDIDLVFPNRQKIKIKDCYKMKFSDIFDYLSKESDIFFSPACIKNNVNLFLSEKEIDKNGYPFLKAKKYDTIQLKFKGNIVTLNYEKYQFIFSEYESFDEAEELIKKTFPNDLISIKGKNGDRLIPTEKYSIQIEAFVEFTDINNLHLSEFIYVDHLATVLDAQKLLAKKLSSQLKPENIALYNKNKKKIYDFDDKLSNIQSLNEVFFYEKAETKKEEDKNKIIQKHEKIDFDDDDKLNTTKTFMYSIPKLFIISKIIDINTVECKKINDLRDKIAAEVHIPADIMAFENDLKEDIKNIEDYHLFKISITSSYPNINVSIPGGKSILIKDCFKKTFDEIIESLEKEGIYYSEICKKHNLYIFNSRESISREGYPLLLINKPITLEVKLIGCTVTLNYGEFSFTLVENESYIVVQNLVKKVFPYYGISIRDSNNNYANQLKSTNKYIIKVETFIKLGNIKKKDEFINIYIDYLDSASDVQKQLAKRLNSLFLPENFILFDNNKNQIINLNDPLSSKYNIDKTFYYDIIIEKDNKLILLQNKKTFYYTIPELKIIQKQISIDINLCKTIYDLKSKIASELHLSDDQLRFNNPPNEKLIKIDNNYHFNLSYDNSQNNVIYIAINRNKKLLVRDYQKMTFNQMIESLEKEGYYFSPKCIKYNFHLYLLNKEIAHEGYPFLSISKSSTLNVKLSDKTVTLKYDELRFTFSEYESTTIAKNLIQKHFKYAGVSIQDSIGSCPNILKSTENYNVKVETFVNFIDINDDTVYMKIYIDFHTTVSDIKNKIIKKMKYNSLQIRPENILLFDINKKEIIDSNKQLISIQELNKKFFFTFNFNLKNQEKQEEKFPESKAASESDKDGVDSSDKPSPIKSIPVIIIFISKNDKKIEPMVLNIALISTISEIEKYIIKKNNIKDEIKIFCKYKKELKPIESKRRVEEIKYFIQDIGTDGKIDYVMYVYVYSKEKHEKEGENVEEKKIKQEDKELNDDSPKKSTQSPNKFIEKQRKNLDEKEFADSKDCIKIIFIFTKNNEKQFYPLKMDVPLKSTIKDIEKMISEKKKIKDKITIKFKYKESLKPIDTRRRVEEIKDFIQETGANSKIENFLYVDIESIKNDAKQPDDKLEIKTKYKEEEKTNKEEHNELIEKSPKKSCKTLSKYDSNSSSSDDYKKYSPYSKDKSLYSKYKLEKREDKHNESPLRKDTISRIRQKPENKEKDLIDLVENEGSLEPDKKDIKKKRSSSVSRYRPKITQIPKSPDESLNRKKVKIKQTPSEKSESEAKLSQPASPKAKAKEKLESLNPSGSEGVKTQEESGIERGNKTKYFYQVGNEEVEIVELGAEATVQTLKEYIGSKRGLDDVSCMKITFAGKELLNNIKLGPMKIGEMKLFVYIPTMEDILLMTAKALRYDEDDNNEYSDSDAESDAVSKDEEEEDGDD